MSVKDMLKKFRFKNSRKNVGRLLVVVVYKMRNYFGVCLAAENDSLCLEPAFKLHVVFDDAVMDDGY